MNARNGWVNSLIGIAVIGAVITGIAGLLAALASVIGGDWLAAGACLIAAALAFGLLASALLGGSSRSGM
jgi:hypothetical protein